MSRNVLIVEDDKIQADELTRRLIARRISVTHFSTELEFRENLNMIDKSDCAAAVVDMMLRWTDPSPTMKMPPPEILKEGFYMAGLRCCRELRKIGIPCIIFTALDPVRIPLHPGEPFKTISKSHAYEILIEEIMPLLS